MSKFIDADRLRAEINETVNQIVADALDPDAGIETVASAKYKKDALYDVLDVIDSLQKEVYMPPVVTLSQFPTLRQSIEEQLYNLVVRKLPGCPPHAGITVSITLRPSTVRHLKKDYEQNGIPATAVGKVFTNTDPMNLYVERDQWAALLGQFDNGQRVRIILVKEDEK